MWASTEGQVSDLAYSAELLRGFVGELSLNS